MHKRKTLAIVLCLAVVVATVGIALAILRPFGGDSAGEPNGGDRAGDAPEATKAPTRPDEYLSQYMAHIATGDYEAMYDLLSDESQVAISQDEFIARNRKIYEGIQVADLDIDIIDTDTRETGTYVRYNTRMQTRAGAVTFENEAPFVKDEAGAYRIVWNDTLIFPQLTGTDRVRVNPLKAERGEIFDRYGYMLAGQGIASNVGLVPGKMRGAEDAGAAGDGAADGANPADTGEAGSPDGDDGTADTGDGAGASDPGDADVDEIGDGATNDGAATDESNADSDVASGDASEGDPAGSDPDSAVAANASPANATPAPTPATAREQDIAALAALLDITPEKIEKELGRSYVKPDTFVPLRIVPKEAYDLKEQLLAIPGVRIEDKTVRIYPMAEKASHLVGYIREIDAEELAALASEGYATGNLIGKTGLEKIFEDRLRARAGCEIAILDADGNVKQTVARKEPKDGEDLRLTIDADLQATLYDQFAQDKSCSVAMNPRTGEVLALVSTPTYDANDFIMGLSSAKWDALNADPAQPLWNRFKATICPGSTFKPITGALGLTTGAFTADEGFGHSGLTWKKDDGWGGYYIKTTKEYDGDATLIPALTYSDNIYFAKAALRMGADRFAQELTRVGFGEKIPFEYPLYSSSFANEGAFSGDIQLADSGYGQGQVLTNPVHLASLYTAFVNGGDMMQPRLLQGAALEVWKREAFTPEAAQSVLEGLVSVVERGTGTEARIKGVELAGKTGTAEIKRSKDDTTGTELGWFALMTADPGASDPLLVVSMVEDVKGRGGSHYVSPKVKAAFEARWAAQDEE